MEDLPLNQAHYEARKAQRLKRSGRLDEARDCHIRAVELLGKVGDICRLNVVLKSLEWQQKYHALQSCLLQSRSARLDRVEMSFKGDATEKVASQNSAESLVDAIFKNLARSVEVLDAYLNEFPAAATDPRLTELKDCHKELKIQFERMFSSSTTVSSNEFHNETEPTESEKDGFPNTGGESQTVLPQLAPLEIPHFDFSLMNDE